MRHAAALALALACPFAADAAPFTLMIHEAPSAIALRADPGPEGAAYWAGFAAFSRQAAASGVLRGGAALEPAPGADGLLLGGYFIIDVPDAAAARDWARRLPVAPGGRVDVIAHAAAPAM